VNLTAGILAIGVAAAAAGCAIDVRSTCAAAGETHPRGRAFDGARASRRRSRPARRVGASTSAAKTRAGSAWEDPDEDPLILETYRAAAGAGPGSLAA